VCLVLEAEDVAIIGRLDCTLVVIFCTFENLCERAKVDTQGDWTVAAVQRKAIGMQFDRDESDMGVIHRLKVL
jgi:hypothetical protein